MFCKKAPASSGKTLSRVLQSARVVAQAKHTVRKAAHGHSRCARSEHPVSLCRWRRSLARAPRRPVRESAKRR
eukprot:7341309-Prymnesium_polylepis.1